jgi:hypothetical protein
MLKRMKLYHGGYFLIETPQIIQGKYAKDFGPGFYCTQYKEQGVTMLDFSGQRGAKKMNGREDKIDNDLFFVYILIEYIARKTLNHRDIVVTAIGKEGLSHIYNLADVYHCENIDKITESRNLPGKKKNPSPLF